MTMLNEGVRSRRLVEDRPTSRARPANALSTRTIEPYLLRRDERGWYVEAYDRTRGGAADVQGRLRQGGAARRRRYEPRTEMADLDHSLGGDVGVARVWFSAERARWELEGRPGMRCRPPTRRLAVAITYGSPEWLISEILRYRGDAEVLEPPALRDRIKAEAAALVDQPCEPYPRAESSPARPGRFAAGSGRRGRGRTAAGSARRARPGRPPATRAAAGTRRRRHPARGAAARRSAPAFHGHTSWQMSQPYTRSPNASA